MKKLFRSELLRIVFAIAVTLGLAELTVGADKKDARVSQIIKDVRLLTSTAGARPASVNDPVHQGQAVRTGSESRAELTFTDQTITRLGANTVFSYGEGAKEFDLASGAALMCVPKSAGTVKINTAAATAAVTGFTALIESHPAALNKILILEGEACVKKKHKNNIPGDPCVTLHAGDMLSFLPGGDLGPVRQFDIRKTMNTAGLVKGFNKNLPKWALTEMNTAANNQSAGGNDNSSPPGGTNKDLTGTSVVDQRAAAASATPSPPSHPPGSPPGARTLRPRGH